MMIGVGARGLGLVEQTLRNWVKAAERVKLNPPGRKVVTPELIENCWDNALTKSFFNSYKSEQCTWHPPRNERRSHCRWLRLHRAVLQSQAQALRARLHLAALPERLEQQSA